MDDFYLKKLERGWNCVLEQCFDLVCENSMKEGKGISIFKFLKKKEGESNCHYFYSKSDTCTWDTIFSEISYGKKLLELYDPDSMVLICVQVPTNDHLIQDDETSGNVKLFYIDTKKEVPIEDEESKSKKSSSSSNSEGLRKRNIPQNIF